ncbi:MAG: hypothetical protein EP298_00320 [Gammaproteobacteria bacterium]|nr:MAG: hypothetical protein EP298_00320 [Gammaproteobacteria bacterium]UTW42041.1 hypothetical protein KFE69_11100 [bacterium SCSIO 12844]
MKYYKLTPRDEILDNELWKANSTHYEPALIQATDEDEAREIAEMYYGICYGTSLRTSGLWLDDDYVEAIEINDYQFKLLSKQFKVLRQEPITSITSQSYH